MTGSDSSYTRRLDVTFVIPKSALIDMMYVRDCLGKWSIDLANKALFGSDSLPVGNVGIRATWRLEIESYSIEGADEDLDWRKGE